MSIILYKGYIINPVDKGNLSVWPNGAMVVNQDGVIIDVDDYENILKKNLKITKTVDYSDCLILPGFIDTHIHLPQITAIAKWGKTLLGWLDSFIFKAEIKMKNLEYASMVIDFLYEELLKNGTTCALVFSSSDYNATKLAFSKALERKMKLVMGQVLMDINAPSELLVPVKQALSETLKLIDQFHGANNKSIKYALTPRFAVTSSDDLLRETGKLYHNLDKDIYLQTHLAENIEETNVVSARFTESKTYTHVYEKYDLVSNSSVFAHAIYLNQKDLQAISSCGAKIAHCPCSNFFLKSGKFPFKEVVEANITFGLGSDIAGGPDINMRNVMKDAYYMQPDLFIDPSELLYLATLGGAYTLNIQNKTGSLVNGKDADFQVLQYQLPEHLFEKFSNLKPIEILGKIIFAKDAFKVIKTYVAGNCLYSVT